MSEVVMTWYKYNKDLMAAVHVQGERQMRRRHVDQDDYSVDVHDFFFVFESYQRSHHIHWATY